MVFFLFVYFRCFLCMFMRRTLIINLYLIFPISVRFILIFISFSSPFCFCLDNSNPCGVCALSVIEINGAYNVATHSITKLTFIIFIRKKNRSKKRRVYISKRKEQIENCVSYIGFLLSLRTAERYKMSHR